MIGISNEELEKILEKHELWLTGDLYGKRADLSDTDLRQADLEDANLYNADLRGADLEGANLTDANLTSANLSDTDLRNVNLRYTDLRGANLRGANLEGQDIKALIKAGAILDKDLMEKYGEPKQRGLDEVAKDAKEASDDLAKGGNVKVQPER